MIDDGLKPIVRESQRNFGSHLLFLFTVPKRIDSHETSCHQFAVDNKAVVLCNDHLCHSI